MSLQVIGGGVAKTGTLFQTPINPRIEKKEIKQKISSSESEQEIFDSIPQKQHKPTFLNSSPPNNDEFVGFCHGGNKNHLL